jgi:hypothetical protein
MANNSNLAIDKNNRSRMILAATTSLAFAGHSHGKARGAT